MYWSAGYYDPGVGAPGPSGGCLLPGGCHGGAPPSRRLTAAGGIRIDILSMTILVFLIILTQLIYDLVGYDE